MATPTDFISIPAGAVLSPADMALMRVIKVLSVTLPPMPAAIAHHTSAGPSGAAVG